MAQLAEKAKPFLRRPCRRQRFGAACVALALAACSAAVGAQHVAMSRLAGGSHLAVPPRTVSQQLPARCLNSACRAKQPTEHSAVQSRFRFSNAGRREALSILTLVGVAGKPTAALAGGIDAARDKLNGAAKALDELVANYDAVVKRGGGDALRQVLNKANVQKECLELASVADDPDEFTGALEEFATALSNADGNAYSSVFAGGSGNAKKNNPAVFLEQARGDVKNAQQQAGKMMKALGPAVTSM